MRRQLYKILAATLGLAITFTLSCSGDDGGGTTCGGKAYDPGKYSCSGDVLSGTCGGKAYNPEYQKCENNEVKAGAEIPPSCGGGGSEGITETYGIKDITDSSFTAVATLYGCEEDGTLEERTRDYKINYSISGTTLSFGGTEFSGNSASLIGIWTREPYSASCENDQCGNYNKVSKAVFTENSLAFTHCFDKSDEKEYTDYDGVIVKTKVIDCGTVEQIKGTQTVRGTYSGTEATITYNGKVCKIPSKSFFYPKEQMEKACKEAYDSNGDYDEILYKEWNDCLKKNNFPEWFT